MTSAGGSAAVASTDSVRDLLGHLCAEIERQQAQIGEQSDQIDELLQENERMRAELEHMCGKSPELVDCRSEQEEGDMCGSNGALRRRSESPPATGRAPMEEERCSVGCQTDGLEELPAQQEHLLPPETDDKPRGRFCRELRDPVEACRVQCCCCGRSLDEAACDNGIIGGNVRSVCRDGGGVGHDGLLPPQPEPAPEPSAPATGAGLRARSGAGARGKPRDEAELELLVLQGALVDSTGHGADAAGDSDPDDVAGRVEPGAPPDIEQAFGDSQQSEIAPQLSCSADSEAPVWTLSPTSFDSDTSSPALWMGLQTGSLPSSPSQQLERALFPAGGGFGAAGSKAVQRSPQALPPSQDPAQSQPPQQSESRQLPSAHCGEDEHHRVLQRHPSSAASLPQPTAAAMANAAGVVVTGQSDGGSSNAKGCGLWSELPDDATRLVRSILDTLDAAQKRLQQGGRRRGERRRGVAGAGRAGSAQGCSQVDIRILLSSATASEAVAETDLAAVAGSFMYILL